MIPRQSSLRPQTIGEYYAKRKASAERLRKRILKRRELGLGTDNTTLRAQLDKLVSLIVRRRDIKVHGGMCLVCMAKERMCILRRSPNRITQAYHIVPRGDDMTRWDLRNLVGACWPCNFGEKESRNRASTKAMYREIHIELIGEKVLLQLEGLALKTADFDLIAKRDEMKTLLEGKQ